jgi:hypothetical protein
MAILARIPIRMELDLLAQKLLSQLARDAAKDVKSHQAQERK